MRHSSALWRVGGFAVVAAVALALAASLTTHASRASGDPLIAAAGDIACDPVADTGYNNGQGTTKACRQLFTSNILVGANLSAVLPLGDDQYECAGLAAFQQVYDTSWGRLKSITYPVPGNHEYQTTGGTGCDTTGMAGGYFAYFGAAAGDPARGYYSYDIGSWHLIALNSNCPQVGGCGAGSQEEQWLRADLAAHPNACTLAYWHYPRFSSSGDISGSSVFWSDLYAAGADVVLSAHKHNYERFAPQNPSAVADPSLGIREFVVGTGGMSHQGFQTPPDANSEVRDNATFGVLELTLHPSSYDWQFVPVAGQSFSDNGSGSCHGAPPGTVASISPTKAAAGATVTISGSGLGSTTAVDFPNHPGVVPTSVSATTVTVVVPGGAGSGPLTLRSAGGSLTTPAFTFTPTSITTFSPASAADGATVTLNGVGFGSASAARVITVGSVAATSVTWASATRVKFVVPQGAPTSGLIHITVDGGGDAASATSLAVTATLAAFSPAGSAAGTSVDILGSGFSNVTGVMFGSVPAGAGHFTVDSPSEIHATVPAGATDGKLTVVRSSGGNLTSAAAYRVLAVTSLSPSSVHVGDTLTINGTNLGNTTGITFPGHIGPVAPADTSSSSVDVVVPTDAGDGALTVTTSDFGAVGTPTVTIIPLPAIADISVTNSPVGSTLQIDGAHFVNVTQVEIGSDNVTADATVNGPTSITVAIPAGESTGTVSVTANGGTSTGNPTLYAHSNGTGQTYYNGNPPNTYDLSNATDAASVFAAGTISQTICGTEAAVQLVTATEAAVWVYDAGDLQGHVYVNTTDTTPICPTDTDPTWG